MEIFILNGYGLIMEPEEVSPPEKHIETPPGLSEERLEELKKKYPNPYETLVSLEKTLDLSIQVIFSLTSESVKLSRENIRLSNKLDRKREKYDEIQKRLMMIRTGLMGLPGERDIIDGLWEKQDYW